MRRRVPRIEVLDEATVQELRKMTPARRLELAVEAEKAVRALVTAVVRLRHPRWTEARVSREVVRRLERGSN